MLSAYVAGRGNGEINVVLLFALPKVILKSLNKHILFFFFWGGGVITFSHLIWASL